MIQLIQDVVHISNSPNGDIKVTTETPEWLSDVLFDEVREQQDESVVGIAFKHHFTVELTSCLFGFDMKVGLMYHLNGLSGTYVISSIQSDEFGSQVKFIKKSFANYLKEAKEDAKQAGYLNNTYAWEV